MLRLSRLAASGEEALCLDGRPGLLAGLDPSPGVEIAPLPQVEEAAVAAAALGLVEGLVGEQQELGRGLDVELGEAGDAGAQGELHLPALDPEVERLDAGPQALRG